MMGFREIRSEDFDAHSMQKTTFPDRLESPTPKFSPPAVTHRSYDLILVCFLIQYRFPFVDVVFITPKSQNCLRGLRPGPPSLAGVSGRSPEECCSFEVINVSIF